jgi:hypothetical protein
VTGIAQEVSVKTKTKAKVAGIGIISAILLTIGGLVTLGITSLGKGCDGGFGLGPSSGGKSFVSTKIGSGSDTGTALIITVEGEKYLVNGSPRPFDEVVSAAAEFSKSQSDQSATQVLLKKKGNARYMTVQKLEDELKRLGIRYRSENDY